jgi:hypothetical protein
MSFDLLFTPPPHLTPGSDLEPSRINLGTQEQGLICGGKRSLEKKEKKFTYGTILCGLELVAAAWETGEDVFNIEQMNQRRSFRTQAHYCYHRIEGAPWERLRKKHGQMWWWLTNPKKLWRIESGWTGSCLRRSGM